MFGAEQAKACLAERKISEVVVYGDSFMRRCFDGLVDVLLGRADDEDEFDLATTLSEDSVSRRAAERYVYPYRLRIRTTHAAPTHASS